MTNERTLSGIRFNTYDRRRLFDKTVVPTPISTMRDVNWEHQAVAMRLGYKSVGDMAIDELLDQIGKLEARVAELEEKRWATHNSETGQFEVPGCKLEEDG